MAAWYLYIIDKKGQLYTGITTDLENRMRQHGQPKILHTEQYDSKTKAIKREKEIKGWRREKKLALMRPI
ncbi:MAG: GIY-YIG nuclease family protein [Endomicrobiales bacterium]|nr:GIY-YIG nuclease family protein [Endomicrobiales bacterium]